MTVSGTDFLASLPEGPSPERERRILEAVRSGLHLPVVWIPIESKWSGHDAILFVSSDALRIGHAEDAVRVNVTAETAQWIADDLGTVLPTSRIVDLVWAQAHVRASPCVQTPDAEMAFTHRMARHSREVDEKIRCRSGLVSNVGKDWVLSNVLSGDRAANYGWFRPDGSPLQPLATAHDLRHVDYSQVARLVRRDVYVDGRRMDIEEVGRSQEFHGLVSKEGPLTVWRQPGTAEAPRPGPASPGADDPATSRDLRIGVRGEDVAEWQRVLMRNGHDLSPWNDDGDFGTVTHNATVSWQRGRGLAPTGVVDERTRAAIGTEPAPEPDPPVEVGEIKTVLARNYTRASRTLVDVVVIHTMEAPEASTTAENVAAWAAGPSAPQASWHYAIDADSVVRCVPEEDVAWAAPSRNHNGIQLEHAGYARQTAQEWDDPYSRQMLARSAALTAQICARWQIPVAFVDAQGLLAGGRGITTHWEVTKGPGRGLTDHVDPGKQFPMERYLELVREAAG